MKIKEFKEELKNTLWKLEESYYGLYIFCPIYMKLMCGHVWISQGNRSIAEIYKDFDFSEILNGIKHHDKTIKIFREYIELPTIEGNYIKISKI